MQQQEPTDPPTTVIDGFAVPADEDVRSWYRDAADQVAMLDDDDIDSPWSRAAYRRQAAARAAMQARGLL